MIRRWRIELLGRLRAQQEDAAAPTGVRIITRFRKQKVGSLLAILAYYPQHPHPRDALVEVLWPGIDPETGRAQLRGILHLLRRELEPPGTPTGRVLVADRNTVGLDPAAFTTDVAELKSALQAATSVVDPAERAEQLAAAVRLYRGELLPGYYEEWVLAERQHLVEVHLGALHQLATAWEQAGNLEHALEAAREAVSADPLREEAHHDLMRLYAAAGQPSAVLRQYQELERLLGEELHETPSAATRALVEELQSRARAVILARGTRSVVDRRSPTDTRHSSSTGPSPGRRSAIGDRRSPHGAPSAGCPAPSLPVQFTRFFGREKEIARVVEVLCYPETRIVTLTGPGGSGKTRLAIAIAGRLKEVFDGAIGFVPLADVREGRRIADTIADALGAARSTRKDPIDQVIEALRRSPWLLVLDNMEHLVEEGARVARSLLETVPTLKLLVTSRQRLDLAGEQEFPVLPLPTPRAPSGRGAGYRAPGTENSAPSTQHPDPDALLQYASLLQLFVDRARAVRPEFEATPANVAAVAQLCDRLEGLPLALELAAGWLGTLSPAQLLSRLSQGRPEGRLELLVDHGPDRSARHRTLRATIAWSFELLSPDLRRLFTSLSIFRGGWTLEAAEAICSETVDSYQLTVDSGKGDPSLLSTVNCQLSTAFIVEGLRQLQKRSLVVAEEAGEEMRYRLLETLREYGAGQLSPEEQALLSLRHAQFYLDLAQRAETARAGPAQREWLESLEREHDNFRTALAWSQSASGDIELGLRLGAALSRFWLMHGYIAEGREHLNRLLARNQGSRSWRAEAQAAAGMLALHQGDLGTARALLEESLAAGNELENPRLLANSLLNLGIVTHRQDNLSAARSLLEESLVRYRELEDRLGMAVSLSSLGAVAQAAGDLDHACSLYEKARWHFEEQEDRQGIAWSLLSVAGVVQVQEDHERAYSLAQQALALFRDLGDRIGIAAALQLLTGTAMARGDLEAAEGFLQEALQLWRELGSKSGMGDCLLLLGTMARLRGEVRRARSLYEESLRIWQEMGHRRGTARALQFLARAVWWSSEPSSEEWEQVETWLAESLRLAQESEDRRGIAAYLEFVAGLAATRSEPRQAARLLGAAEALREAARAPLPVGERSDHDRWVAAARAGLSGSAFAEAWAEGRRMTPAQAVAEAVSRIGPRDVP